MNQLIPKKTKFRKVQKGKIGKGLQHSYIHFGNFGLRALEYARLTNKQLEVIQHILNKFLKKIDKNATFILRVFPHIPVTQKPVEVRMGKGKGIPTFFVAIIKPGQILVEIKSTFLISKSALELIQGKLPLKTKII